MNYLFVALFAVVYCLPVVAETQNPPMTEQKIFEFSTLPHKGNITTGFFQCMTKFQGNNAQKKCLPAEIKFQAHVLKTVYGEYSTLLSASQRKQLAAVQQSFDHYRQLRCNWYVRGQVSDENKLKQSRCLLKMIMDRRLELERFVPMTEE